VDAGTPESHAVQLARAVRQVIQGEEVRGPRPLSAGAIFAIAIAAIAALIALLALLLWLALRSSSF
jgi:hypothetical protein